MVNKMVHPQETWSFYTFWREFATLLSPFNETLASFKSLSLKNILILLSFHIWRSSKQRWGGSTDVTRTSQIRWFSPVLIWTLEQLVCCVNRWRPSNHNKHPWCLLPVKGRLFRVETWSCTFTCGLLTTAPLDNFTIMPCEHNNRSKICKFQPLFETNSPV